MKLSILIPYIRRHEGFFYSLKAELAAQILPYAGDIEVLTDNHEYDSIGTKRNRLLEKASGEYLCFIDADDKISANYIKLLMEATDSDCDCASLKGEYSLDGKFDGIFEHSIRYKEWRTTNSHIKYERYHNHLNCIKSEIAKRFLFPQISWAEDKNWSDQLFESGLIKTEYYIEEVIYYYKCKTKTNVIKNYSQNNEQAVILDRFGSKKNGKFIDIGAYDTEKFSNVRALYKELNFKGVLVEPAPGNFSGILESYKDDKEITVLNVAIGETNAEIDFYDCGGDAISSSEILHRDKWAAAGVKYTKIKVQQMAVVDFFNQYGKGTDFLSIDTESTNLIIFRLIEDWVWETISMLCIEHDGFHDEIEEKLSKFGFVTVYQNAENILLSKGGN